MKGTYTRKHEWHCPYCFEGIWSSRNYEDMLPLIAEHKKSHMKPLKKHPKQQRMEEMTFPIIKPGKKTKEMHQWDRVMKESADALEENRCKSCGVYPGLSHTDRCESLLEIRKRAWKEYKKNDRVIWTGREYLRSINDDLGFRLMPRIVWRVVAVGVLVGAVIISFYLYGKR